MTVYEALTVALIFILAAATTAAIYLGLLGWVRQVFVVRCAGCHHMTFAGVNQPQHSCPHCRHPVLLHPLHAAIHPEQSGDVGFVDGLKY